MKKLLAVLFCLGLVGCATIDDYARSQISFINYNPTSYPEKLKDSQIDLFFQGKPDKKYDVIGEISGYIIHDYNIRPMLEIKTRQVGGDGVIEIVTSQSTMTGTSVQDELINPGESYETRPVAVTTSQVVTNIKGKIIKYRYPRASPFGE